MKLFFATIAVGMGICLGVISCASSGSVRSAAASHGDSQYRGYVLPHDADFWETDSYMCNGLDQTARDIAAGEQVDPDAMEGHRDVVAGTRVSVIGHKSGYCPGHTLKIGATEVVVHDAGSEIDGMDGYILEGLLAKQ